MNSDAVDKDRRCGRPSWMTHDLALYIFECLGQPEMGAHGRTEWDCTPMRRVAWLLAHKAGKSVAAAKSVIQRLLDAPVPESRCHRPGKRWKDCRNPHAAYWVALKKGLLPAKGPRLSVSKRS
jgi:hypothetical protein